MAGFNCLAVLGENLFSLIIFIGVGAQHFYGTSAVGIQSSHLKDCSVVSERRNFEFRISEEKCSFQIFGWRCLCVIENNSIAGHGRVKIDFPSVATSRSCLSARRKFLHSFPALVLCLPTIKPGSLWSGKEPTSHMSGGGGHLQKIILER